MSSEGQMCSGRYTSTSLIIQVVAAYGSPPPVVAWIAYPDDCQQSKIHDDCWLLKRMRHIYE